MHKKRAIFADNFSTSALQEVNLTLNGSSFLEQRIKRDKSAALVQV
jgi:hypothetical protein